MYYIRQLGAFLSHRYWYAEAHSWSTSTDYATRFDTKPEADEAAKSIPATDGFEICCTNEDSVVSTDDQTMTVTLTTEEAGDLYGMVVRAHKKLASIVQMRRLNKLVPLPSHAERLVFLFNLMDKLRAPQ